jgi:hypothetical protein
MRQADDHKDGKPKLQALLSSKGHFPIDHTHESPVRLIRTCRSTSPLPSAQLSAHRIWSYVPPDMSADPGPSPSTNLVDPLPDLVQQAAQQRLAGGAPAAQEEPQRAPSRARHHSSLIRERHQTADAEDRLLQCVHSYHPHHRLGRSLL